MAILKFEEFLYSFLVQLKDKDIMTKEMKDALVKHFDLTEEDCSLKTKSVVVERHYGQRTLAQKTD